MSKYSNIFSPIKIGNMRLKNRIVMSPIGSNFAQSDGQMSPEHIEYYRLRAAGGVGLIIMENVCVDFPKGANGTTQLRLDKDCFMPQLYKFNEEMHKYGCCTAVQINHAGCTAVPERIGTIPVSPSSVKLSDGSFSQEMNKEEILNLVKQYGKAAARAKMAGFDAVEIHAGHGYLINQFLSNTWNHRTDEFGGSTENRARFCRLVIDEVRKNVGEGYPILIRLSLEEFTKSGNTLEESLNMFEFLRDGIDLVDASVGVKFAMDVPQLKDGWRTYVAQAVKKRFGVACAVMGNIRDPQMADDLIADEITDLVVIGRGLIADPDWVNKAETNQESCIRPCISCNIGCVKHRAMLNQPIRCTVNPSIASEEWHKSHKVTKRCNVVVIGAGVSGLEAACSAAESGCNVTVIEKDNQIGGWLKLLARVPEKFRMKRLLDYYLNRAENLKNLVCLTGISATKELILAFKPDVVVCSIGSKPFLPPISGLQEVITKPDSRVFDVLGWLNHLDDFDDVREKEIVLAGGGPVALDIAEYFINKKNHVTIVEMLPEIGKGLDGFSRQYFTELLDNNKATILTSNRIESFSDNSVMISDGVTTNSIIYDYAFCCLGLQAKTVDSEIQNTLEDIKIPIIYTGDTNRPRQMYEAISEGRNIIERLKQLGFYESNP